MPDFSSIATKFKIYIIYIMFNVLILDFLFDIANVIKMFKKSIFNEQEI